MKVLVAGGTGRLGRLLVERLAHHDVPVRVLTRDVRRADPLQRLEVEVVVGDLRRPESLVTAVDGADLVVAAAHGFAGPGRVSPRSVDLRGNANLVDACRGAGCGVVMLSAVDASPDHPMGLLRCKHAAEQLLRASGLPWTVVRATAFVELWAELVVKGVVFGRGDNPINFVSVCDVADLVARAVLDDELREQVLEIGGPQDLSLGDLAGLVGEVRGEPVRVRHVPRPLLRALAPLHRLPKAALVMDTADMTFRAGPGRMIGPTDARQALAGLRAS